MNWKLIKSEWQKSKDERWQQHPKNHGKQKKLERQNKKQAR